MHLAHSPKCRVQVCLCALDTQSTTSARNPAQHLAAALILPLGDGEKRPTCGPKRYLGAASPLSDVLGPHGSPGSPGSSDRPMDSARPRCASLAGEALRRPYPRQEPTSAVAVPAGCCAGSGPRRPFLYRDRTTGPCAAVSGAISCQQPTEVAKSEVATVVDAQLSFPGFSCRWSTRGLERVGHGTSSSEPPTTKRLPSLRPLREKLSDEDRVVSSPPYPTLPATARRCSAGCVGGNLCVGGGSLHRGGTIFCWSTPSGTVGGRLLGVKPVAENLPRWYAPAMFRRVLAKSCAPYVRVAKKASFRGTSRSTC